VIFQFGIDVTREPGLLAPFSRIVVATGAVYPLGTGPLVIGLLDRGAGRWPLLSRLLSQHKLRDWFYYRARRPTAPHIARIVRPGQTVTFLGDAAQPGKSREAIASAFEAALLGG
jgi:hypothetical protein